MLYSIDKDMIVFISCMFTHFAILDATFVEFRRVVKKIMLFHQIITSEHIPQKNKTNQRNLLGSGFCVYIFDSIFRVWSIVLKCLEW